MTPFRRLERSPMHDMMKRHQLLSHPLEFYRPFFGGRTPTLAEKVQFVEEGLQRASSMHVFENNLYHVELTHQAPFIHLSIIRLDGGSCNEWRHLQQIKNELVGPECEGVELFPAENRLVDTTNEYHLWVHADPNYRFPFGFTQRFVLDKPVMGQRLAPQNGVRDSMATRSAAA